MNVKKSIWILLGGFAAGYLNGLCGSGGGTLLYFLLLFTLGGGDKQRKDNFALSSVAILSFCVVSLFPYVSSGKVALESAMQIALPAAAGGVCGALLLGKIKAGFVQKIFAVLVIIGGGYMLLSAR